jgi:hypothetical protein
MQPAFPGMDPWLEHPDVWSDLHSKLITAMSDVLNPQVVPRYVVRVEMRTTILSALDVDLVYRPDVGVRTADLSAPSRPVAVAVLERPRIEPVKVVVPVDEEIEETYLTVQELLGRKLVTVIEVLSPTNKNTKDARGDYLKKRHNFVRSGVNLVEIDLLRSGEPMPVRNAPPRDDYRILVCRPRKRGNTDLYEFSVRDAIPEVPIPLLPEDPEPLLDLNEVLHDIANRARYDLTVDYGNPPKPPLRTEDEGWALAILGSSADNAAASQ